MRVLLFATSLLLCLCSCATLRGSRQRIKVTSTPTGAEIYQGSALLGTTPTFIELKRHSDTYLWLKKPGKPDREIRVQSEYRWGDSFAANFVWLNGGLIGAGIGLDLWTGSAWDYISPPPVKWNPQDPLEPTPLRRVAIAPPRADNEVLSDELALVLQSRLKEKYPGVEVIPYDESLNSFARYSYTNETVTPDEFRDDLYFKLGVTHVIESETFKNEKQIVIVSSVKDIYTEKVTERFENTLENKDVRSLNKGFFGAQLVSLMSIVPNTVAFNFANYFVGIEEETLDLTTQYRSRIEREPSALSLLTGFTLKNIKSSEIVKRWRPTVRLVPSLVLSYNRFRFERDIGNELVGTSFRWYTGSIGFGPEFALEMPVGLIYFNLIPSLGASVVTWSKDGDKSDFRGSFALEVEMGYLVFVSQNVNLRFYVNALGANKDQWGSVLSSATGRDIKVDSAGFGSVGFSLGYYFPQIRSTARRMVR
jgi:hypothetical protein